MKLHEAMSKQLSEMDKHQIFNKLFKHNVSGIWNRESFNVQQKHNVHVAMVDLDSLKYYNDTFGHEAGDKIIKTFGQYLVQHFGIDSVFHMSGDEFVVVCNYDNVAEFNWNLHKARELTQIPFSYGIGRTLANADTSMLLDKTERKLSGERPERHQCPAKFDRSVLYT